MTKLERAVIEAAKAWAPTHLTRTSSGNKERLQRAVYALIDAERLADFEGDEDETTYHERHHGEPTD